MGSSGFARRYYRNHCCFLFLWVLRWFTSPRSPLQAYVFSSKIPWLSPRRVPPFGHLRINVRVQLPEAFRSLPRPSSQPSAKASTVNPYTLDLPSMNYIDSKSLPRVVVILFIANLPRLKTPHGPKTLRITLLFTLFDYQRNSSVLELNSKAIFCSSTQLNSPHFKIFGTKILNLVGLGGFEPPTSRLSGVRSNQTEL